MNKQINNSSGSKRKAQNPPSAQPRAKRQRVPRAQRANGPRIPQNPGQAPQPFAAAPRGGAQRQVGVSAAYASGQRSSAPRIQASRDSSRIVHRELIASVVGSQAFAVANQFSLNPGLQATFPWLSTQAQGWERYRFNKLKFCYYTRTGSNVPGSVQLVPDYDAADPAPVSEQVASSYEDVEEDAPWKDIECELRPAALHALGPSKFIRQGVLAANQDIKTYDAGTFFLCTTDGTAVNWGKLWVEYDVTLMTPQLNAGGGGSLAAFQAASSAPTSASFLAAPTLGVNSLPLVSVSGNVVTFNQAGQFMMSYNVNGTTCTQTSPPAAAAGAVYSDFTSAGSGTSNLNQDFILSAVVGSTVTFDNTLVAGVGSGLIVAAIPANLQAA